MEKKSAYTTRREIEWRFFFHQFPSSSYWCHHLDWQIRSPFLPCHKKREKSDIVSDRFFFSSKRDWDKKKWRGVGKSPWEKQITYKKREGWKLARRPWGGRLLLLHMYILNAWVFVCSSPLTHSTRLKVETKGRGGGGGGRSSVSTCFCTHKTKQRRERRGGRCMLLLY